MAIDSFGAILKMNTVDVGALTDINPPEVTAETKDVTTHQSTNRYSQVKATLLRAGQVDFKLFVPTKAALDTLMTAMNGLASQAWTLDLLNFETTSGNHEQWQFSGPLTRLRSVTGGPADVIEVEASIGVTGKPVRASVADPA